MGVAVRVMGVTVVGGAGGVGVTVGATAPMGVAVLEGVDADQVDEEA